MGERTTGAQPGTRIDRGAGAPQAPAEGATETSSAGAGGQHKRGEKVGVVVSRPLVLPVRVRA